MSYGVGHNRDVLATFCEAEGFLDDLVECYGSKEAGDEAYRMLQLALLEQPSLGDVMPGASGLRKVRWPGRGHGKRGGIRVLYQYVPEFTVFLMMAAYAKADVEELSADERRALAQYAEGFVQMLKRRRQR